MQVGGVRLVGSDHLPFIFGAFGLDDDADAVFGGAAVVDHEVLAVFGVYEIFVAVPGCLEKIGDKVFEVFLAFAGAVFEVFEQAGEFGFEPFEAVVLHVLDAVPVKVFNLRPVSRLI